MIAKKKKITRKQIQEDKLVTTYVNVVKFYEKNQTVILLGAAIIVAVVLASIWYSNKMEQDNILANNELSRTLPLYEQGNYQTAIDGQEGTPNLGLKAIVEEYGSSSTGELAKIYLANAYYFLGDYKSAEEYYGDYSGSNKEFKAAALAGIAACKMSNGDLKDAAEYYSDAADVYEFNPNNAEYLLEAGKIFIKLGKKDKAEELFDIIKDKYPKSNANRNLNRYTAMLEN